MTTKYRIVIGFCFMILVLGVVAWLGYANLQRTSDDFIEYERLAQFNVLTSDMSTAMFKAAYNTALFLDHRHSQYLDEAGKYINAAAGKIKEAGTVVRKPERIAALAELGKSVEKFKEELALGRKSTTEAYAQYENGVQKSVLGMSEALGTMARQARDVDNTAALVAVSDVWEAVAAVRSSLTRFSESREADDAARARVNLGKVSDSMKKLEILLVTDGGRKTFGNLMQSFDALNKAFLSMVDLNADASKRMDEVADILNKSATAADKLSAEVDAQMRDFGQNTLEHNDASQKSMLGLSAVGMVLGLAMALFIVSGIIRVLRQLDKFAEAVAGGDFAYKINVREKGEIGQMIRAMRQIPAVLETVIQEAGVLAGRIVSGDFRNRLDPGRFNGSFSDLARAVNVVGDAYTGVLDSLPLPIMACNKGNEILFLNKSGQSVIGGNHVNTRCGEHIKAAECGDSGCFGARAMSSNAPYSGETAISPKGRRMEVAVTAMPMRDLNGAVAGYMEIITDLTEIKDKQNTMLKVAAQAADISNRVAAASEQLAAQVEQISRGAEIQRSRVESTASAMTEMNATVLEVAKSAGQASEQSDNTREKADSGAGLVNRVVVSINTVNGVAVNLQNNMQELGHMAESIGGVMNVISDIADQTNLLALNAAIEAARAGEAGRGFAVVADEVRKLAEKTMSATHEVGASIAAIQNSTRTNINEVGNAVKSINEATNLANLSGTALKEIVDLAAANSSVVASIATAAEEQSATSEEINHAIEEINRIVSETTDGMVQSSSAVQELSRMSQELRRVMEVLK